MSTVEAPSATWQVTVPGAETPIALGPGLRLDDAGHHRPEAAQGDDAAVVRLDAEDGTLVIRCTSRTWVLASSERMLGDRVTVDRPVELALPRGRVGIRGGRDAEPRRLRLERRHSVNWLRPDPAGAPSRAKPPTVSEFVTGTGRAGEARLSTGDGPRLGAGALRAERRSHGRANRHRARSRPRWPVTLATIAVYLGGLTFSEPVHTPVTALEPASPARVVAKPFGRE